MQYLIQHASPEMFLGSHGAFLRYVWVDRAHARRYTQQEAAVLATKLRFATVIEVSHART